MFEVYMFIKRSINVVLLFVFIVNFLILEVKSDLPVHCKRENIEGAWTFHISTETFDASLQNPQTHCGHGFPDKIATSAGDINFKFKRFKELQLVLASDYSILSVKSEKKGTWTPVYDEAFVAYYQNSVFTAFMKYFLKDKSLDSSNNDNFSSNCDKTMIGWHIPDNKNRDKNWSCFYGFKSKIKSEFTSNRFLNYNRAGEEHFGTNLFNSNFIEISAHTDSTLNLQLMKYDQRELVKELNSMNLSWKASIHEEFKGLSFFQLKEKLGLKRKAKKRNSANSSSYSANLANLEKKIFSGSNQPSERGNEVENVDSILNSWSALEVSEGKKLSRNKEEINLKHFNSISTGTDNTNENITVKLTSEASDASEVEEDSQNVSDPLIIQKYLHKELHEIDVTKLPKNWDWRNVGGGSYVPKPRRQLNCGSCYIFSLVSSLESRLRILTNNKDQTEFSRQFPLGCSFYTEGCKGGYPFLVAKFFHEFEVIPEACAPYNPDDVQCHNTCDYTKHPIKYFVSKYEYLGGFYGATNEVEIIKELRARGPIPGNMTVPWTFSYYKNGIFSQNKLNSMSRNTGRFSKTTLFDKNLSWSSVDHSILLVGYGEENGVKYWIGMNTWGTQWGEAGYFKILRGENDCNIETMGDAARISFKSRHD